MTWTRRRFLISSATLCAGAAIIARSRVPLLSVPAGPRVRLLRSRTDVPSDAFERGVRAALGGDADVVATSVRSDLARWREMSASVRGSTVLGVVSTSEFVLVNELIRDSGARLLFLGEHAVRDAGSARHVSTTSAASAGVDRWLARSHGAWPETLGFALGRVAVLRWDPAAAIPSPVPGDDDAPVRSSCVSFVFAV